MNCYAHIRDQGEALIERLMPLAVHPDTHRCLRDEFQPADDLDRAARYFFLNHTSFAGITHLPVCYWGTRSPLTAAHAGWAKRIRRASALLQGVHLTNQDFEAVIEAAPQRRISVRRRPISVGSTLQILRSRFFLRGAPASGYMS